MASPHRFNRTSQRLKPKRLSSFCCGRDAANSYGPVEGRRDQRAFRNRVRTGGPRRPGCSPEAKLRPAAEEPPARYTKEMSMLDMHGMTVLYWKNIFCRTMCKMSSILETLKFILLLIYYYFEAFVMKFCQAPKNVAGEIVLITGSANGIGKQIALNFARLGAILILWDIDEQGNEDTAELTKRNGALAVYTYKCDCSKREEIYAVADQIKKEVGDVTILINNAGILNGKNFIDLLDSEIEETLDVNIKAHFWTCKAFLPAMISCNHGHLVTISSTGGLTGANKLSDYCASKWAEIGFLESVAFELQAAGKKGIKTTIVFPYYVDTEMVTGVITTRPCLYPILDVEYVGRRIVDAILKEKFYLFIPPWACSAPLKIFLPTKVIFLLGEYLGIFNNLDHFKGRKKRKGNKN